MVNENGKKGVPLGEQFRVLTETSPDCIKLFDIDGNLKYINPGGIKEHGLNSVEEAIKTNWKAIDTVTDDNRPTFEQALKDARKGKVTTIELKHKPEESNREYCLETVAPVKDNDGNVIAIFGVSRDISEIKRIQGELTKTKEELEVEVDNRTQELQLKVDELEKMNQMLVGRELRMIELKKEIGMLKKEVERYKTE